MTFLLRRTSVFDNDEQMQRYIRQGKATLVSGDGLKLEDVKRGWEVALEAGHGTVDFVLFSIGLYRSLIPAPTYNANALDSRRHSRLPPHQGLGARPP